MRKINQEGIETIQRGSPGKGLPNGKREKTGIGKGSGISTKSMHSTDPRAVD